MQNNLEEEKIIEDQDLPPEERKVNEYKLLSEEAQGKAFYSL